MNIGQGYLNPSDEFSTYAIVTDSEVRALYGESLLKKLSALGSKVHLFSFPSGEANKTRETKELLENQFFEKSLGRDTCVIALGGGVVTDLAGYLAATYCRGLPLVLIPTTLLGMVDASLGGKNGVNTPYGKNMVGTIYQPKKIWIDVSFLKSLPLKELKNGIVEMIKHGLIMDAHYFEFLETHSEALLNRDVAILEEAIIKSCHIKNEIIEEDISENGKRRLLNFGHTIGHAIEQVTHYAVSHGEAVAIGLLAESYIAQELGYLKSASLDRILAILEKYSIPLTLADAISEEALLQAMSRDKKSKNGKARFVLINEIGASMPFQGNYCTPIEEKLIKQAIQWMKHALCCR